MTDKIDAFDAVALAVRLRDSIVRQLALTVPHEVVETIAEEIREFDRALFDEPRPDRELYEAARTQWAEKQPLARLYSRLVGLAEAGMRQEDAAGRNDADEYP